MSRADRKATLTRRGLRRSVTKRQVMQRWRAQYGCPCGGEATVAPHVIACPLSIDPDSYPF